MAQPQVLQFERAIRLPAANGVEIPFPANLNMTSTSTSFSSSKLVSAGANFITRGVKVGDIVYNVTTPNAPTSATVTALDSESQLSLSANIITAASQTFTIYSSASNVGTLICPVIYVGTSGNLIVETEGGDTLFFGSAPVGVLQVRVRRVIASIGGFSTAATNLIAIF